MIEPPEADARRWLRFAREDLATARVLADSDESVPRIVCFHAQQAAEKAIKAILVDASIDFPRTHALVRLLTLLPAERRVTDAQTREWDELSDWAVESRYPADLPEATETDANRAILLAEQVVLWSEGLLNA